MIEAPLQFVTDPGQIRYAKVLNYAIAGALYNLGAYANKASKSGDRWQFSKASRTIYLGVIAGALVAFMDPTAEFSGQRVEAVMYLAIPIGDQLINAWNNLRTQIEHNQFPDWSSPSNWFESGLDPSEEEPVVKTSQGAKMLEEEQRRMEEAEMVIDEDEETVDPDEYFDAISPMDDE